jgi:hypothetical protein
MVLIGLGTRGVKATISPFIVVYSKSSIDLAHVVSRRSVHTFGATADCHGKGRTCDSRSNSDTSVYIQRVLLVMDNYFLGRPKSRQLIHTGSRTLPAYL